MEKEIDLVWITKRQNVTPKWALGKVLGISESPSHARDSVDAYLSNSHAEYLLFWDSRLGIPEPDRIAWVTGLPGEVWHAGLKLGMAGLPHLIDFVDPVWMLNRDPDPEKTATSWRLSLSACLLRTEVARQLGHIDPAYDTLTGASLDMGHRYMKLGALIRHVPGLVDGDSLERMLQPMTLADELRFVHRRYGSFWLRWAVWRSICHRNPVLRTLSAFRRVRTEAPCPAWPPLKRAADHRRFEPIRWHKRVSVLIPTLDRYPYLRNVLNQLEKQTVEPLEVICIDQTRTDRRQEELLREFKGLNLQYIYRETAGQCSSRNVGLVASRGDYILFLDDDVEIPPDLIERHAEVMDAFEADASAGVADEIGAGPPPYQFTYARASDVFPTGNTLVRKSAIRSTGLFDLAYERGERADADLGMRFYLAGRLVVLNPNARLVHYRAPRGGLREHKARINTYTGSRQTMIKRQLAAPTQIYLWQRYFTERQVHEALTVGLFSTLSRTGSLWRRVVRMVVMACLLPHTWLKTKQNRDRANLMLGIYPQIPLLESEKGEETAGLTVI